MPSHLYSFSFAPKPDWGYVFSPQPEILDYLKDVTDRHRLRPNIVFNAKVSRAHWDDAEYRWHVFTESGEEYVSQFLISGAGALHIPSLPDIPGLSEFDGPVFHTAQWDHTVDLTGKRVAVIGTGASAIQVVPELVKTASQVQLYQRTAAGSSRASTSPSPPLSSARSVRTRAARGAAGGDVQGPGQRAIALAKRPELMRVAG